MILRGCYGHHKPGYPFHGAAAVARSNLERQRLLVRQVACRVEDLEDLQKARVFAVWSGQKGTKRSSVWIFAQAFRPNEKRELVSAVSL